VMVLGFLLTNIIADYITTDFPSYGLHHNNKNKWKWSGWNQGYKIDFLVMQ
jgi:hypothetical protein